MNHLGAASFDKEFDEFRKNQLAAQNNDSEFQNLSKEWMRQSCDKRYSYQFDWLGIPIIQMPTDIVIFQEIVWKTRPDLIIETGIARGGSINFWASIQNLCDIDGEVIGVDIDIRGHAKDAISKSKFRDQISLIEGDSTAQSVVEQVEKIAAQHKNVMLILDSNHTHEHVLKELEIYTKFVSPGGYILVLDTIIEDLPVPGDRPWQPGDNPMTAVIEFMKGKEREFSLDSYYEKRSLLTVAPHGYWMKNF
jgi:cephalosporin hydroxylase